MVEIPDPVMILGLVLAFVGGLFTLFIYSRLKAVSASNDQIKADSERLVFYERQLIDLKIKLDAIDLENLSFSEEPPKNNVTIKEEKPIEMSPKPPKNQPTQAQRTPNMGYDNVVEAVLGLITDKSRTSRDIQITLGKSREHISRMMKKLYEDGLVKRNVNTKPYTYSITQKGHSRLDGTEQLAQTVTPHTS